MLLCCLFLNYNYYELEKTLVALVVVVGVVAPVVVAFLEGVSSISVFVKVTAHFAVNVSLR